MKAPRRLELFGNNQENALECVPAQQVPTSINLTDTGQKKAPSAGPFLQSECWRLDSRFQYPLDRRDARIRPFFPHLVDHLLNVGKVLRKQVIEAALLGAVMGRGLRLIDELCTLTATAPLHILGSSNAS